MQGILQVTQGGIKVHYLIELLLQLLVGVVDAELLEAVHRERLESVYILRTACSVSQSLYCPLTSTPMNLAGVGRRLRVAASSCSRFSLTWRTTQWKVHE